MKVAEALELIRRVGEVESFGSNLKLKFPAAERAALEPAINILRNQKAKALALLAEALPPLPLGAALKGRAIELWSDSAGGLFLVADEEDARRAMERFGVRRGQIYTAMEARRIITVNDSAVVAEIHNWKRRFDGVVRQVKAATH